MTRNGVTDSTTGSEPVDGRSTRPSATKRFGGLLTWMGIKLNRLSTFFEFLLRL